MTFTIRAHTDYATLTLTPEPWMLDASCSQVDPEMFFAEKEDRQLLNEAKRICRACPVLEDCAAYVETHPQQHGVWAGRSRGRGSRR